MKLFEYDNHIGKWRVLVNSRDIAEGAIKNKHIGKGEIHPDKFAPCVETDWLYPILNAKCACMMKQIAELRHLVTSYVRNGIALSRNFGAGDDIGITQRSITNEITRIWNKINDITGEPGKGIYVTINPKMIMSDGRTRVCVAVKSDYEEFESIKIYVNDELVLKREHTEGFVDHFFISGTSCIRTVAMILGKEYTDIQIVNSMTRFYIGSGETWNDAMTDANAWEFDGSLCGSYDITVNNDGEKMFVVIPNVLNKHILEIEMNGFEVPVTVREQGDFTVYESTNRYVAGSYKIDIADSCNCHCNENE